jgi:hypothetical protein
MLRFLAPMTQLNSKLERLLSQRPFSTLLSLRISGGMLVGYLGASTSSAKPIELFLLPIVSLYHNSNTPWQDFQGQLSEQKRKKIVAHADSPFQFGFGPSVMILQCVS